MIIETKYEPGDTVWFIHNNQICKGLISKIEPLLMFKGKDENPIQINNYTMYCNHLRKEFSPDSDFFISKKENEIFLHKDVVIDILTRQANNLADSI